MSQPLSSFPEVPVAHQGAKHQNSQNDQEPQFFASHCPPRSIRFIWGRQVSGAEPIVDVYHRHPRGHSY